MDYTKIKAFAGKPEKAILSAIMADQFLSVLFQNSFVIIPLSIQEQPQLKTE